MESSYYLRIENLTETDKIIDNYKDWKIIPNNLSENMNQHTLNNWQK